MRALAVLSVVAYHYAPGVFPGGFIGVDIFFVISGYLITGILAKSFEKRSFGQTLLDFYQRRIRRIFPAVGIVLVFCLVVGWLTLFADEYASLGKHMAAGAGFVENIVLWLEAGYFDADAITKPFLHFWSLAVEEQFYIFWPFGLWLSVGEGFPGRWSCILGDQDATKWIAAMGDSHAGAMIPALDQYGKENDTKMVFAGKAACLLLLDIYTDTKKNKGPACHLLTQKMATKARTNPPIAIIFIQRWTQHTDTGITRPDELLPTHVISKEASTRALHGMAALRYGLNRTLSYYQSLGVPVVLMEDNPQQIIRIRYSRTELRFMKHMTEHDLNHSSVTLNQHLKDKAATNRLLENVASQFQSVSTLNINSAICNGAICPWIEGGKFLYFNDDHLSITGALKLTPLLKDHLDHVLSNR